MKTLNLLSLVFLFFIWGCNNTKPDESIPEIESKTTIEKPNSNPVVESSTIEKKENTKKSAKKGDPTSTDFRERLKATEPATKAEFQNWLPESLGELTRIAFTKTRISQDDIASAGAIYKNGDVKKLELSIVDGASKDGLLAINSHYIAHNSELSSTNPSGYEKTYVHKGLKALETYVKDNNFYRILLFHNTRFGITIESYGLSHDELWSIIEQIKFETLNEL